MASDPPPIALKPDLAATVERFEAWWVGEVIDRPPVNVGVKPTRPYDGPASAHATLRERWMDVACNVERMLAELSRRDYVGDALPLWMPNIGPELTSTLYGCDLEFSATTSWSVPFIESVEQWAMIAERPPDFANPYWATIEAMTDLAVERFAGRALVGIADLHGNYDILAGLREPQLLCMDLMDDPDAVQRAAMHAADGFVEGFRRLYAKVSAKGQGSVSWVPAYHRGPAYIPSCDFWCMLSDEMARERVMPAVRREMQPMARSIFHLDGPQALRHLDLLLAVDELDAVQWVCGAGRGPASRWIDVYRRCLAAGKSVQVIAGSPADALAVLEAVGPKGVWLCVGEAFESVGEAEAYLAEVARRSAGHGAG